MVDIIMAPFLFIEKCMNAIEAFVDFFTDRFGSLLGYLMALVVMIAAAALVIWIGVMIHRLFTKIRMWLDKLERKKRRKEIARAMAKKDMKRVLLLWLSFAEKYGKKHIKPKEKRLIGILCFMAKDHKWKMEGDLDPEKWLREAVAGGDVEGMVWLARWLIREGNKKELNIPEAADLLRAAVSKGSRDAQEVLKTLDDTVQSNLQKNDGKPCMGAALFGHAESQYHVGLGYVGKDEDKAISWMRYAEKQGYGPAQGALLMLLMRKDARWAWYEAKALCEKILEKEPDHVDALSTMAVLYLKGEVVRKDHGKAAEYLKRVNELDPDNILAKYVKSKL